MKPSENLGSKISQAIAECDLFVVLWSKNAQDSDWVSQEIGRAGALNKNILPLVLTEGMNLPGFICNLKYLSTYNDPEGSVVTARELIVNSYNKKAQTLAKVEEKKQKDKESLALMGIGAFVLWAFSK